MAKPPAINDGNFGAWLLKCNPDKTWDIAAYVAEGNDVIHTWSVQENYRSALMKFGDPILLWVTKNKGPMQSGFWGAGYVTGPAGYDVALVDPDDPGHWNVEELEAVPDFFVPVAITIWEQGVLLEDVKSAPGLEELEIFRSPAMGNPNWLNKEQYAALSPLLPTARGAARSRSRAEAAAVKRALEIGSAPTPEEDDASQGPGDPIKNLLVEESAILTVTAHYEEMGWRVQSVEHLKVGWDLTCTPKSGKPHLVEVKGVSGRKPSILLTANELRAARAEPEWRLAVVTDALVEPTLTFYGKDDVEPASVPYVYRVDLSD